MASEVLPPSEPSGLWVRERLPAVNRRQEIVTSGGGFAFQPTILLFNGSGLSISR